MFALSLFLPMFFILLPRKIPPPPMGRIQDMGKKSKKAMPCSVVTPPAFFPTLPGVYRRSRERAGLAALLRPRIPARPVQLVHSPIRVALVSQRRGGGRPGHGHQHARPLYWDPASQHSLAHTTPQTPTPLHAGRTKGRLRTRVVVHRAPDRDRAPPLSWPMAKTPW
jgi:hypothetical protein